MASYKELSVKAVGSLKNIAGNNAALEARILLCLSSGLELEGLLRQLNDTAPQEVTHRMNAYIKRRQGGEPISYITGQKEFYGLNIGVSDAVLIPRPETEMLVSEAIALAPAKGRILDLGTGSGAISIALAKNLPAIEIIATDISNKALQQAEKNISKHGLTQRVKLVKSDWFANILPDSFDLIISNPPYISKLEQDIMATETLLFEPKSALFAENNGLRAYEQIISRVKSYLKKGGCLLLEIGFSQKEPVLTLLRQAGLLHNIVCQDLSGHDRVVISRN